MRLDELQNYWKQASGEQKKNDDFAVIPKGRYEAAVTNASLKEEGEKITVMIEYTILKGEYEKRKVFNFYNLTGARPDIAIASLKQDLFVCDLRIENIETLPSVIEDMIGLEVEIYVKPREFNGKTYYNATINKKLSSDDLGINANEELPDWVTGNN